MPVGPLWEDMVDDSPPRSCTDIMIAFPEVREARDAVLSAETELRAFPSRTDPSFDNAAYQAKLQVVDNLTARYAEISTAAAAIAAAAAVVTPPPPAVPVLYLHFQMGTPKLLPRWVGPFQIRKEVGNNAYELVLSENWKIHDNFHISQLAEHHHSGAYQPPPPAELLEGELEYEVECIRDHKILPSESQGRPSFEYQIQWRGSGSGHDTSWYPERNLKDASQAVQNYWDMLRA